MVIVACVAICFACAKNNKGNETNDSSENGDKKALNIDKDKLPYSQEEIFEQLFDINNYIEINLDISDEELLKIQKDYEEYSERGSKSPIYRQANL